MCKPSELRVHSWPQIRTSEAISMAAEEKQAACTDNYWPVKLIEHPASGDVRNTSCDSEPHLSIEPHPTIHWVEGAIIVGAGPAGLATAACLQRRGVPSLILEKDDCIGSLWRYRTYDRLRLHIAKQFCELPHMPFPSWYPTFPSRVEFLEYLEEYARAFKIMPLFQECVVEACFAKGAGLWQVVSRGSDGKLKTFISRWLVVATGENAQPVLPQTPGFTSFKGNACHTSEYKSGKSFQGKKVLVVGSGNSGLEVALDLTNHKADVFLSVRSQVHVLPREMLGISTFSVAMMLLRVFSVKWTDHVLVGISRLILGETGKLGFQRPMGAGPMEMKSKTGKSPSLDAGTLSKVRQGCIQVRPGVRKFNASGCVFEDDECHSFDAVIFATGFRSNVPSWLKDGELSLEDGYPNQGLWKGKNRLYSSGFSRKGLLGVSMDAERIAEDLSKCYMSSFGFKSTGSSS